MEVKQCRDCEIKKPLNKFPADRRRVIGVGSYCYKCCNVRQLISKHKNAEHYKKYMREYMRKRRSSEKTTIGKELCYKGFLAELIKEGKPIKHYEK